MAGFSAIDGDALIMKRQRAILTAGLGFGDEAKGATVDALVRKTGAHTVLRYNGGSQAGHNVVTPEGVHHCFAQFGAGTLVPGTMTYCSQYMFVDPLRMKSEYDVLCKNGILDGWERLIISNACPVITPFHKFTGQIRELARGDARRGSCGMGVGEAMRDFARNPEECLTMGDLFDEAVVAKKLQKLQERKTAIAERIVRQYASIPSDIALCFTELRSRALWEVCIRSYEIFSKFPIRFDGGRILRELFTRPGTIVGEGAQGVLLDPRHGYRPYVTKSDCTFANAEALLQKYQGRIVRLGITRTYATRHGNGPFVTEDEGLTGLLPDPRNVENQWQGKFRVGWFDLVALRYAARVLGVLDGVVMSHLDRIRDLGGIKVCVAYETKNGKMIRDFPHTTKSLTGLVSSCRPIYRVFTGSDAPEKFFAFVRSELPAPLAIVSRGPAYTDREYLGENLAR